MEPKWQETGRRQGRWYRRSLGCRDGAKLTDAVSGSVMADCSGWSPDGLRLAVGLSGPSREIKVLDVTSNKELAVLSGHKSNLRTVSWSPDGRRLATSGGLLTILVDRTEK